MCVGFVFFQAEDGIRDLVRSRGLGDVYKRQVLNVASNGGPCFVRQPNARANTLGIPDQIPGVSLSLIHI